MIITFILLRQSIKTYLFIFFQDFRNISNHRLLSYSSYEIGDKTTSNKFKQHSSNRQSLQPYEGQMQQLIINGKSYFELADNNDLPNIIDKTVTFLRDDVMHKYPISFFSKYSWFQLPKIDASQILLIQFHFKTLNDNGLLLYNAGENGDFLTVELIDGQVNYRFSLGRGIHTLKSKVKHKLNDNKWHLVSLWRSTRTNHELTVDSLLYKHSLADERHLLFTFIDVLNVGGLSDSTHFGILKAKGHLASKHGFVGCLASLEINGQFPSYDDVWLNHDKIKGNISKGCGSMLMI